MMCQAGHVAIRASSLEAGKARAPCRAREPRLRLLLVNPHPRVPGLPVELVAGTGFCLVFVGARMTPAPMTSVRAQLTCTVCIALSVGCRADSTIGPDAVAHVDFGGRVTRLEMLGRYTPLDIVPLLQLANAPGHAATTSGFYLYRVTYKTQRFDNEEILVSGLLGVPDMNQLKGVVSWQHGTNTYRPDSISKPTLGEGLGISALFAGNQYIYVAADYIGLGISTEVHPYYHVPSTVNAVTDLLEIGEIVLSELAEKPDGDLYLAGFSQGGTASVAVHRAVESTNPTALELAGTASVGGAFKLAEIAVPFAMERNSLHYLGYLFHAYSHIYDQPLSDVLRPPYVELVPEWYDGEHDADFLTGHLPAHRNDFFNATFLSDFEAGVSSPQWFYDALAENQVYDWSPVSPLRLYYGSHDQDAAPQGSIAAYEHMQALGGNVVLADVGAYDHTQSLYQSIADIQSWFNEMESQ